MKIQQLAGCCGIKELTDLVAKGDPVLNMKDFVSQAYDRELFNGKFRYGIFAEANQFDSNAKTYGRQFAKLIIDNKLGTLVETERNVNPNSGNEVKVWVWTINHEAVKKWGLANPVSLEDQRPVKPAGVCVDPNCVQCTAYRENYRQWEAKVNVAKKVAKQQPVTFVINPVNYAPDSISGGPNESI